MVFELTFKGRQGCINISFIVCCTISDYNGYAHSLSAMGARSDLLGKVDLEI